MARPAWLWELSEPHWHEPAGGWWRLTTGSTQLKGVMRHIPEEELHAYLDQGLSRSQCVEIESHWLLAPPASPSGTALPPFATAPPPGSGPGLRPPAAGADRRLGGKPGSCRGSGLERELFDYEASNSGPSLHACQQPFR